MSLIPTLFLQYKHEQTVAASTWVINHNLGVYPAVDVYVDYNGEIQKILPLSVTYVDAMTCNVEFSAARAGTAIIA